MEIKQEELIDFLKLDASIVDCAYFFQCEPEELELYIANNFNKTFKALKGQHLVPTKFHLMKLALDKAESSTTLLMFCLKNICHWTDKIEAIDPKDEDRPKIEITYNKLKVVK